MTKLKTTKNKQVTLPTMPKPKKATADQKKKIQEGVNRMGKKAVKEMKDGVPPEAKKLAERLNNLDAFITGMVNESKGEMTPKEIVEMLVVKARHTGFAYSADATPEPVLGWMTGLLYFNAFDVFSVTKAHVLADKQENK